MQRGRGGGPAQQGLEQIGQGFSLGPAQHGRQQQGRGRGLGRRQPLGFAQPAEGVHVAVELALLGEQPFDQGFVLVVVVHALEQQLAEGAQRRQGIAQLVHQHIQLFTLALQLLAQALLFEIEAERLGEAARHRLQPLAERVRPGHHLGFHLDGPQQHLLVAQR